MQNCNLPKFCIVVGLPHALFCSEQHDCWQCCRVGRAHSQLRDSFQHHQRCCHDLCSFASSFHSYSPPSFVVVVVVVVDECYCRLRGRKSLDLYRHHHLLCENDVWVTLLMVFCISGIFIIADNHIVAQRVIAIVDTQTQALRVFA
jgi:hypothetical protein